MVLFFFVPFVIVLPIGLIGIATVSKTLFAIAILAFMIEMVDVTLVLLAHPGPLAVALVVFEVLILDVAAWLLHRHRNGLRVYVVSLLRRCSQYTCTANEEQDDTLILCTNELAEDA